MATTELSSRPERSVVEGPAVAPPRHNPIPLRQILLNKGILTLHQIMRRSVVVQLASMQHQKISLGIQSIVRDRNHMVLSPVERVRGQRKRILQTMGHQQRAG